MMVSTTSRSTKAVAKPAELAAATTTSSTSQTSTQVNFRADPETRAALDALTADGTSLSEVIRAAIKAARWAALKAQAVAEMKEMMADPEQATVTRQVYEEMNSLRAR